MSDIEKEYERPLASNQDDPKNSGELDKLNVRLTRLNREAALLGDAMRQKPKKS